MSFDCLIYLDSEIRNRIDSLEMLDQSLQAYPADLNPKLVQTLEKIRNAEKKKSPTVTSADKRRAEFLKPMQERITKSGRKEEYVDMEVEQPVYYDEYEDRYHPGGYRKQRKVSNGEEYYNRAEMSTQTKSVGYGPSTSQGERYSRRMEEEDEYYRKQHRPPSRGREPVYQEENWEGEQYDIPQSADWPAEDEFTFNRAQKKPASSSKPKRTEDKDRDRESRKTSVKKSESAMKKKSVSKDSKDKDARKSSTSAKQDKGKGSLDKWIKSEEKEKKKSKDKDKSTKTKSEKKKSGPTVHDFGYRDSDEEKTARKKKTSSSPTPKKSDRGPQGLHDWINRRVTGYLIFHNTMHDGLDKDDEDDHLNRLAGKKWQELSKVEKEEYNSFAMNVRVSLKKQFKDVDNDDPELKELQERVDQKIKKIKKE